MKYHYLFKQALVWGLVSFLISNFGLSRLQAQCAPGEVVLNETYCYDDNDNTGFNYESADGSSPMTLTFTAGGIESCCDDITIYDGSNASSPVLYNGSNGGDLSGLSVTSTGTQLYMEVDSDGSISCDSESSCCSTSWAWTVCNGSVPPPPPIPDNDLCADATALTVGACPGDAVAGNTENATPDGDFSCDSFGDNAGVWYSFVAPASGSVDINVTNLGSGTPESAVFDACGGTEIACSNSAGTQEVSGLTPGNTYYVIVWGDVSFGQGAFEICVEEASPPPPPPANDLCADATPIACGATVTGSTSDANAESSLSFCGTSLTSAPGVWYALSGDGSEVTVSTCNAGTDYDTKLGVFSGSCGSLNCEDGNDDAGCISGRSEVTFSTAAGETYYIYVTGFSTNAGNFELSVDCVTPPVNDNCATATPVTCGATVTGSTSAATAASSLSSCGTSLSAGPGVWYALPGDGSEVTVSTCNAGTDYDTKLGVFSGSCGSLVCVGGNDDAGGGFDPACDVTGNGFNRASSLTFSTSPGEVYYIYVTGFSTNTGNFELSVTCEIPCDIALTGGSSTPETCPGDNDGSISVSASCTSCDGVEYSIGGAYQSSGTFTGLAAGSYTVTARDTGDPSCSATTTVSVGAGSGGAILSPWTPYDVGSSGTLGNDFAQNPCDGSGIFTIDAGGNNAITSTTDAVGFVGQTICGAGSITLKLESVSQYGYGGPMIRESAAAGAKQVSMFGNLTNIIRWENRATTNGPKTVQSHYRPFPIWLRLVRQGDWVFGYYSTTGANFNYVHAAYVPMDNCVQIGMASFTYVPFAQGTAVFSNVSVTGGSTPLETPEGWSADPVTNAEKATLFPNPAQDLVTVDFGSGAEVETQLVLRNKLGQQVRQLFVEPGLYRQELNVNDLTSGMYLIELHREGQPVEVLRFIKQ